MAPSCHFARIGGCQSRSSSPTRCESGANRHTPGLVGRALDTDLIEKTFWTVSAWKSNAELNQFDQTDPHRSIKCTSVQRCFRRPFVFRTCRAGELPIGWDEVRRRISETET